MPTLKLQALKPPKMPSGVAYAKALEGAVQKTAGLVLRDLQSTTRTWKHKPLFDVTITRDKGDYIIAAGTDDKIYGFVDKGTKRHAIRPKRSKYLRFSSGYAAKTRVGIIGSVNGGAFGSDVFSKAVMHPGFKGRGFTVLIAKRRQVTVRQETSQAMAKIARTAK